MQNVIALVLLAACASTSALPPAHPASAQAPTGRLAGPPASLRPGVVKYDGMPDPNREPPPQHHHHHSP